MMALFAGYADAHGTHGRGVANAEKGGKLEIRTTARTIREPVTEALWQSHIDGKMPIGIIPIMADNNCIWGCIDVDDYSISHEEIVHRLKREKLPMLVCKTKSGGAHVYVFLTQPIPARAMMEKLRDIAALLGFGGSEIFPKQTEVLVDRGDLGNWLNMPYLDGDKTERYCVNDKGKGLTLSQFLNTAEAARLPPDEFLKLGKAPEKDPEWGDGPPCLETMIQQRMFTAENHNRNNGLVAIATYCKKKFGKKDFKEKVRAINLKYFDPPLDDAEVEDVIGRVGKKEYNYKCKEQPIVQFCNGALCRTRRFGVGGSVGAGSMPKMANLAVLNTDEPIWFLDVDNLRIEFPTAAMMEFRNFQQRCLEVGHMLPASMKRESWVGVVQDLLVNIVVIDAPPEVSTDGQFFEILESHLTDRQKAQTKEEILLGKAWWDDESGRVYFRIRDIQEVCDRMRFRSMTRTEMINFIKKLGGEHERLQLRGKSTSTWHIPIKALSMQTESHVTPKIQEDVI